MGFVWAPKINSYPGGHIEAAPNKKEIKTSTIVLPRLGHRLIKHTS